MFICGSVFKVPRRPQPSFLTTDDTEAAARRHGKHGKALRPEKDDRFIIMRMALRAEAHPELRALSVTPRSGLRVLRGSLLRENYGGALALA